jgi:hypothetical protein
MLSVYVLCMSRLGAVYNDTLTRVLYSSMQSQALFVLFESASGFGLFEVLGLDEIGNSADKVQESVR